MTGRRSSDLRASSGDAGRSRGARRVASFEPCGTIRRGFALVLLALTAACGGQSAADGSSHGDAGADSTRPEQHTTPPAQPSGPAPGGVADLVLAVRTLSLGEGDQWQQIGYDLDGLVSHSDGPFACQVSGARGAIDGAGGIDNALGFGLAGFVSGVETLGGTTWETLISEGRWTFLLRLENLGEGPDYYPVRAHLYQSATRATRPAWDGSDVWNVETAQGSGAVRELVFEQGYVRDRVWVSGPVEGVVEVPLHIDSADLGPTEPMLIRVLDPVVTLHLPSAEERVVSGVIAGVVGRREFHVDFCDYSCRCAGGISCCDFVERVAGAADLLLDGSIDPDRPCDALSLGLGFTAAAAQLGDPVAPVSPQQECL